MWGKGDSIKSEQPYLSKTSEAVITVKDEKRSITKDLTNSETKPQQVTMEVESAPLDKVDDQKES
jgi:hypothetical protein